MDEIKELRRDFEEYVRMAAERYQNGNFKTCAMHLRHAAEAAEQLEKVVKESSEERVKEELGL